MRFNSISLVVGYAASAVYAQSMNMSLCDKYTTALLKNNTGDNQLALLTKLVNTAVIGNYTMPNMNAVPGILAPGMQDGQNVSLAGYFDGSLLSSNVNGVAGSVNFLDGGGAAPLKQDMAANDTSSNQYKLLTHLYEYFGTLLGCSQIGMNGSSFKSYEGDNNMYEVHKFMYLNKAQMDYFITQVALAAQSFGVSSEDIKTVGTALNNLFNMRCSPKSNPVGKGEDLQAMCIASDCPTATSAVCDQYNTTGVVKPATVPANLKGQGVLTVMNETTTIVNGSMTMTSTMMVTEAASPTSGSMAATKSGGAAVTQVPAVGLGLAAVMAVIMA